MSKNDSIFEIARSLVEDPEYVKALTERIRTRTADQEIVQRLNAVAPSGWCVRRVAGTGVPLGPSSVGKGSPPADNLDSLHPELHPELPFYGHGDPGDVS